MEKYLYNVQNWGENWSIFAVIKKKSVLLNNNNNNNNNHADWSGKNTCAKLGKKDKGLPDWISLDGWSGY